MIDKTWISAGNAIFTISNGKGDHYTYKVKRRKVERGEIWFVSLLTGPNNETNYTYLGLLNPKTGFVRLTRKSRFLETSTPVRVIRWGLNLLWKGEHLPPGYGIMHEGRCGRCGRRLTHPEAIRRGYGPECWEKIAG